MSNHVGQRDAVVGSTLEPGDSNGETPYARKA